MRLWRDVEMTEVMHQTEAAGFQMGAGIANTSVCDAGLC